MHVRSGSYVSCWLEMTPEHMFFMACDDDCTVHVSLGDDKHACAGLLKTYAFLVKAILESAQHS
jgi:hypothetical protein